MKLNKILLSAAVVTFAVTLLSCDRNGGDIGPYFGIWALDGIDADGNPDPAFVPDHTFFSFHSNVIEVTLTDEYHQYISRFGTWSEPAPATLRLDFSHHDDLTDPGTGWYAPPEWIHITSPVTDLHIDRLTSSRMELTYTAPAAVYTYRLHKVNR